MGVSAVFAGSGADYSGEGSGRDPLIELVSFESGVSCLGSRSSNAAFVARRVSCRISRTRRPRAAPRRALHSGEVSSTRRPAVAQSVLALAPEHTPGGVTSKPARSYGSNERAVAAASSPPHAPIINCDAHVYFYFYASAFIEPRVSLPVFSMRPGPRRQPR